MVYWPLGSSGERSSGLGDVLGMLQGALGCLGFWDSEPMGQRNDMGQP